MDRREWLKQMRAHAEALYDRQAPKYWNTFGLYPNAVHRQFIAKLLGRLGAPGDLLSAACGAGRYDGLLVEAGHRVLGIDQSGGMLTQARNHFPPERYPTLRYQKLGLQEMAFQAEFDGAICVDALEHIPPEDWPGIILHLAEALKPGGALYLTVEVAEEAEVRQSYERARALGLPVVWGEVADQVGAVPVQSTSGDPVAPVVYHYYPPLDQVRAWFGQAGLAIEAEGADDWYAHFLARKSA
jgi:2-polyprenyl-3-methyl-5-hydroxy-6-metoxy-1,4-benzoquinol methylase